MDDFDDLVGKGYTDENGYYEFVSVSNLDFRIPFIFHDITSYGIDAYVVCYAKNHDINVMHNPTWMDPKNLNPLVDAGTINFKTSEKKDVSGTIDFDNTPAPGLLAEAFATFDSIWDGFNFMADIGYYPKKVNVFWDDSFTPGNSYYFPQGAGSVWSNDYPHYRIVTNMLFPGLTTLFLRSLRGIHIKDDAGWRGKTPLHEYGHFIMDSYADLWPPFSTLEHSYNEHYDENHAWVEGWAHFFSAVVRKWAGHPYYEYAEDPHIETNYSGEDVEAAIAGILWDIFDPYNPKEPEDKMSVPFSQIFNVLINYDPNTSHGWPKEEDHSWTLPEFFNGWYYFYPESITDFYNICQLHNHPVADWIQPPPEINVKSNGKTTMYSDGVPLEFDYPIYSFTVDITNPGTKITSYEIELNGLKDYTIMGISNTVTVNAGETKTIELCVMVNSSIIDYYYFDVVVKQKNPLYMEDRKTVSFALTYDIVLPDVPSGFIEIYNYLGIGNEGFRPPDYAEYIWITKEDYHWKENFWLVIRNWQNFDDIINVKLDLSMPGNETFVPALPEFFKDPMTEQLWKQTSIFMPAFSFYVLKLELSYDSNFFYDRVYKINISSKLWSTSDKIEGIIYHNDTPPS